MTYPNGKTLVLRSVNDAIVFRCEAQDLYNDPHLKWLNEEGQEITDTTDRYV